MGGKPIEGQEVMQTRTVTIYTGARIRVPEHIQRIDTHSTHGWQMRYGQPTLFFSDGQGPGNGPRPALKRATEALRQRIAELREKPIPGTQTIGEFMQRRLSPAMATVAASERRLTSLSERISRTSALLRTRVDIVTEAQNQELLAKLTRGQELQLQLQTTVEGLSIAAISYYVVSLLLYGAKALHAAGMPIQPEVAVGVLVPLVLWGVWRTTRKIHEKLKTAGH